MRPQQVVYNEFYASRRDEGGVTRKVHIGCGHDWWHSRICLCHLLLNPSLFLVALPKPHEDQSCKDRILQPHRRKGQGYCVVSGTSNSPIWVTNSESGKSFPHPPSIVQIGLLTDLAIVSHALVIYIRNSFSSFLLCYSTDLYHLTCKIQYAAR